MIAILQPPICTFDNIQEATRWVQDQLPADADVSVIGTLAGNLMAVQIERAQAERRKTPRWHSWHAWRAG